MAIKVTTKSIIVIHSKFKRKTMQHKSQLLPKITYSYLKVRLKKFLLESRHNARAPHIKYVKRSCPPSRTPVSPASVPTLIFRGTQKGYQKMRYDGGYPRIGSGTANFK